MKSKRYRFSEKKITIKDVYQCKNRTCFYDPIREILVPATPEEIVRQKLILWLVNDLDVPQSAILCEEHLGHFQKGNKSRADILVKASPSRNLLLIECKRSDIPVTQEALDQAHGYAAIITPKPKYIMVTNGVESIYEVCTNGKYQGIKGLQHYKDLLHMVNIKYCANTFVRNKPLINRRFMMLLPALSDYNIVSSNHDKLTKRFAANLYNCLMNEHERLSIRRFQGWRIKKDLGLRYTEFGNIAGGSWNGYYRCF